MYSAFQYCYSTQSVHPNIDGDWGPTMSQRQWADIDFGTQGGKFRVSASILPELIKGFENIKDMVAEADKNFREATADGTPPSQDYHSITMMKFLQSRAEEQHVANVAFREEVQKLIDLLQYTFEQYQVTEKSHQRTFSKHS